MNQWYPWSHSSQNSEEKDDQNNKNIQNQAINGSGLPFDEVDALLADEGVRLADISAPSEPESIPQEEIITEPAGSQNPRLTLLKHALEEVRDTLNKALDILNDEMGNSSLSTSQIQVLERTLSSAYTAVPSMPIMPSNEAGENGRVVEGVFDGQCMVGADGKQYSVPANYASKSKLVEGDVMKLTIAPQGTFVYKQIGPVERKRVIAQLEQNPDTHDFYAVSGEYRWKILTASVTYFKGIAGDEVVVLVSQSGPSKWAAVENIIKKI